MLNYVRTTYFCQISQCHHSHYDILILDEDGLKKLTKNLLLDLCTKSNNLVHI